MTQPAFQLCRNPRCRSHMPPAFSRHAQFCTKGCWEQFHRKRCVVCEKEFERKSESQRVCGRRTCRSELRKQPEIYRPFHCGPLARIRLETHESYPPTDRNLHPRENPHFNGVRAHVMPDRAPAIPNPFAKPPAVLGRLKAVERILE